MKKASGGNRGRGRCGQSPKDQGTCRHREDATMGKCVEKKQTKPCARASGGVPGHGRDVGVAPVQKC